MGESGCLAGQGLDDGLDPEAHLFYLVHHLSREHTGSVHPAPGRWSTRVAIDWNLALAGGGVGFIVGLTGMGGGALMTPILVLVFGIPPLAAVSSDLVASMVMKPIGAVDLSRFPSRSL